MNNTTTVHPIEFFIACIINLIEFIAWTINEIAGHHTTTSTATATPTITTTPATVQPVIIPTQPTQSFNEDWLDYVSTLIVKQLRQLTGITNSRFNKARLIEAAITYA